MPRAGAALLLLSAFPAAAHDALDVQHVRLELRLEPAQRRFDAVASLTLRLSTAAESVVLDAVELEVRRVRDGQGRDLGFETAGGKLHVRLPQPAAAGAALELVVEYGARPRRGLYFVAPSPARRALAPQAWTSFWPEDARFVLPCHDDPADKASSEILLNLPASWRAMATGVLTATRQEAGRRLWHYRLESPHSVYLMSFVAGEYEEVPVASGSVPLAHFVYAGRAEDARQSFARAPEMLRFFADRTGLPYPWPKLALSVAADFVHGAMENVSAITFSDHHLLDARGRADTSADGVLAHELAHQWWGDLVTPRSWNELWLSEGFATYFADLWVETAQGAEAASWRRLEHADAWGALDAAQRGRRVVPDAPAEPWSLLDANVYARSALILAHLRQVVGEEAFWGGLRGFVGRHALGIATSEDLQRSLSQAAGRDLSWFFDQWLRRDGVPSLRAAWRFDPAGPRVVVSVRQGGPALVLPLDVVVIDAGSARAQRLFVERGEQEFSLPVTAPPLSLVFDPGGLVPADLEVSKPPSEWLVDLARAGTPLARARAARALAAENRLASAALRASLLGDTFWGVRREAAKALRGNADADTREALRQGLRDPDPRVRAACVSAIGAEGAAVGSVVLDALARETSDLVAAAALRALGEARAEGAWEALVAALGRESAGERLRVAALDGLVALGDPRALPLVLEQAAPGRDASLRKAAVAALGRFGRGQAVALSRLRRLLADDDRGVRAAAARALGELRDQGSREALRAALLQEDHPSFRRDIERALALPP